MKLPTHQLSTLTTSFLDGFANAIVFDLLAHNSVKTDELNHQVVAADWQAVGDDVRSVMPENSPSA